MTDKELRTALIRLANEKPEVRRDILPLLKAERRPRQASNGIPSVDAMDIAKELHKIAGELEKEAQWYPSIPPRQIRKYVQQLETWTEMLDAWT